MLGLTERHEWAQDLCPFVNFAIGDETLPHGSPRYILTLGDTKPLPAVTPGPGTMYPNPDMRDAD